MTRGRHSSDRWARYAHHLLDRVRKGGTSSKVTPQRIDWALAYLGDKDGSTKVPPMTGKNRWVAAHPAPVRALQLPNLGAHA